MMFHRVIAGLAIVLGVVVPASAFQRTVVHHPADDFAAREIRRYTYLATGALPTLLSCQPDEGFGCLDQALVDSGELVILTHPGSTLLQHPRLKRATKRTQIAALDGTTNGHLIQTVQIDTFAAKLVIGAGKFGPLYAAYTFAEGLGVRFELAGEILPDPTAVGGLPLGRYAHGVLPDMAAFAPSPLFDYRGLQPFHDFPEGPDWWDTQHYKQIITQLSKMKANFLGLHTYPYADEKSPTTGTDEPTVWVGTVDGLNADGSVKPEAAYPTSYANTLRNEWAYGSIATSDYSWGTSEIFETDCWAPPPTDADSCPQPTTPEASAAFFERTSTMLNDSFTHGNLVGVEGCLGTETPLSFPAPPSGPNPCTAASATCYQDSETRILPYTVAITDPHTTIERCAYECNAKNYTLAGVEYAQACFCGNELPPASKKLDPSKCNMPCAGNASEECGGSYTMAVYSFTCSGPVPPAPSSRAVYDGIFTRLAAKIPSLTWYWVWTPEAWEWGKMNSNSPVFTDAVADLGNAMASRNAINPSLKMATNGWVLGPLPDRSIFDKTLPTTWDAITSIDMNTGHDPVDPTYANVTHHAKWVIPWMEDDPTLTAPQLWVNRTLEHMQDAKTYGCSGLLGIHWRTKETGPQIMAMLQKSWNPTLTSQLFWMDWATAAFGANVAPAIAAVFNSVDSFLMPIVVGWTGGPGKMIPQCKNPSMFEFISTLEAIAPQVTGMANVDRFAFWLAHFAYMRGIVDTECAWAGFNTAMAAATTSPTPATKAALLTSRIALISNATIMMTALQMSFVDVGTLGTYMNIEGHSLSDAITSANPALVKILGPLPPAAMPPRVFSGKNASIIVPTLRTTLGAHEEFELRALVLAPTAQPKCVTTLFTRVIGSASPFTATLFSNTGRSVFEVVRLEESDFEYYVSATCGGDLIGVYPAGAPVITQSVVIMA